MAQTQTTTLKGTSVMPSLTVNDVQQSLNFYAGLGFEVEDRWEQDGTLLGVMLKAGTARLGLSQDDGKKGKDRVKGVGMRIYVEAADDINQVAARAKAAGVGAGQGTLRHRMGHACLRGRGPERVPDDNLVALVALVDLVSTEARDGVTARAPAAAPRPSSARRGSRRPWSRRTPRIARRRPRRSRRRNGSKL